jgi:hypothetical protein
MLPEIKYKKMAKIQRNRSLKLHYEHFTDVEDIRCTNTWTVTNFPYIMERAKCGTKFGSRKIEIPLSSAKKAPVSIWKLSFYPSGFDKSSRGYLAMAVSLLTADLPLSATVEMSIATTNGEPLAGTVQHLTQKFVPGQRYLIPRIISAQQLTAEGANIINNTRLKISYEIRLIPQVLLLHMMPHMLALHSYN